MVTAEIMQRIQVHQVRVKQFPVIVRNMFSFSQLPHQQIDHVGLESPFISELLFW